MDNNNQTNADTLDHGDLQAALHKMAQKLLQGNANNPDIALELKRLANRLTPPLSSFLGEDVPRQQWNTVDLEHEEAMTDVIGSFGTNTGQFGTATSSGRSTLGGLTAEIDISPTSTLFQDLTYNVELASAVPETEHRARVHARNYFGSFSLAGRPEPVAIAPLATEFLFCAAELCCDPPPSEVKLCWNEPLTPSGSTYYPLAAAEGYDLQMTQTYLRGYIYVAGYNLAIKSLHRELLLNTEVPPNINAIYDENTCTFLSVPLPGMIEMVPGVPFVLEYYDDEQTMKKALESPSSIKSGRLHTVGCVQTLKSLKSYPDYAEILECSVKLAKLTWGCSPHGNTGAIKPIYEIPGLKENDRSAVRAAANFHHSSSDGSYSLSSTVIKGDGQGTFAPAVQADTAEARLQISSVLQLLNRLYRLVMPKCLSKFEMEIIDFQSLINNVFVFGGMDHNGTSVQLNISSLNIALTKAFGSQGGLHADTEDWEYFYTFLALVFRTSPGADPGPFCLARPGLYIREKDAWIVFLVFKGVDLHFGHAPVEDAEARKEWQENLEAINAWNLHGPQNRAAYVTYSSRQPTSRFGSLNVTPPTHFGNYGSSQVHKEGQKNFAMNGMHVLGTQADYANRLGREAVFNFWNSLQVCDLDLDCGLEELFKKISFKDHTSKITQDKQPEEKQLTVPPYLPDYNMGLITKYQSLWAWYTSEADEYFISMPKLILRQNLKRRQANKARDLRNPFSLPSAVALPTPDSLLPTGTTLEKSPEPLANRPVKSPPKSKNPVKKKVAPKVRNQAPVEYEVEKVEGHRTMEDGSIEWLIKWKHYDSSEWLTQDKLEYSIEYLGEYNDRMGITVEGIEAKRSLTGSKRTKLTSVTLAANLTTLKDLLCVKRLEAEVDKLHAQYKAPKAVDYFKNIKMPALIENWGAQVEQTQILGDLISQEEEKHPNTHSIGKSVLRLRGVQVALAPNYSTIDVQADKVDIIKRSFKHETCLSLVAIFEWYSQVGPLSAEYLVKVYKDQGYKQMSEASEPMATLIDHIMQYCAQELTKYRDSINSQKVLDIPNFGLTLSEGHLESVPNNLYGIIDMKSTERRLKFPAIPKGVLQHLDISHVAAHCLQEVITTYIIMPKLRIIDGSFNTSRIKDKSDIRVLQRSITRGAILWAVQEACQGDGIFSSEKIQSFLSSPAILFNGSMSRERVFSASVLRDKHNVLIPLLKWIKLEVAENPKITGLSYKLRGLQHHLMFELFQGCSSLMEDDQVEETAVDRVLGLQRKSGGLGNQRTDNSVLLDYDTLIINGRPKIRLGKAFLIIQEALNYHKKLQSSNEVFFRVLMGQHATTSSATFHNPDHTNPIRAKLCSTELLRNALDGKPVTSAQGISNLLAWFGTGQGFRTQNFLTSLKSGFFSNTLDEMVTKFQDALEKNIALVARYPNGKVTAKLLPGYLQANDCMIWGQACNDLCLTPTVNNNKKLTIKQKLERYWAPDIQEQWKMALGELYEQDIGEFSGQKPKWQTLLQFVNNLDINGFKTGLTPFQLCNSLVLLGLAESPDIKDMAKFISSHRNLGAFTGLTDLGFNLPKQTLLMPTLTAFKCIHDHLSLHLSKLDKEILDFGPIFVEHLLCKISRWENRLTIESHPSTFSKAAREVEDSYQEGQELFPPFISKEFISDIINDIKDYF